MTEWTQRGSPEFNQMYAESNIAISPYANANGGNYLQGSLQYSHIGSPYSNYSTSYVANESRTSSMMYLTSPPMRVSHQTRPLRASSGGLQSQPLAQRSYYRGSIPSSHHEQLSMTFPLTRMIILADTEEQESVNQETQQSEPVTPALEGYPNVDEFDRLMNHYVANLSPKKQDKALIHAKRAANIKAVLIDKKTTSVESAQFRFWVKKMFTLHPNDYGVPARRKKICHDNKPVAIREKLFKILTRAHKQCQHGGRDKTSAQVRRVYSWVPKELISRFVKICPTCQMRRGTNRSSPGESERSPEAHLDTTSPNTVSSDELRRASMSMSHTAIQSPLQLSGFSSTFHHQNRWMQPLSASDRTGGRISNVESRGPAIETMQETNSMSDHAQQPVDSTISANSQDYGSMQSSHMMEYSGSSYETVASQRMQYQSDEMQYAYKMNHYKG